MKKTLFVQPRHIYAPQEGQGHIYTPTSLWTVGAKLIEAGADIDFADENLRPAETGRYDTIGVNLVGAPYIPVVRERFRRIFENGKDLLIGGKVVTGLSQSQFFTLFGGNAIPGSHLLEVVRKTGAQYGQLEKDEDTSLIPSYKKITDDSMREY